MKRTALLPLTTSRRALLSAALLLPGMKAGAIEVEAEARGLLELEGQSGGRLGLVLLGPDRVLVSHRPKELFPACSTFKALLAAAVLDRSLSQPGLLNRSIRYSEADLKTYAPVTSKFVDTGMTVGELCAAAVQYSDNVAANLLMRQLEGPRSVTAFARSIGDDTFRLDRWEPELNSAVPGDPRDTCTPLDMARNLQKLLLSSRLPREQRDLLKTWLVGNTTGAKRIRAGVPADWTVGDKTGTGAYASTNDIAVLWPNEGRPLVLAIYFTHPAADAGPRDDVLAQATRLALSMRG